MKYLLDTNILSEIQKSDCNIKVKTFTDKIPLEDIFICAISIGELHCSIEKLPPGKDKQDLLLWLYEKLPEWFNGRIIVLDTDVMAEWGRICARATSAMPAVDSMIASAAITHNMALVTKNIKKFENIQNIIVVDPWEHSYKNP